MEEGPLYSTLLQRASYHCLYIDDISGDDGGY